MVCALSVVPEHMLQQLMTVLLMGVQDVSGTMQHFR